MSELVSTAFVTGGSRGIGKAIVKALAKDGYQVYFTYISREEDALNLQEEIAKNGGKAKAFKLDAADTDAITAFFDTEIKDKVALRVLVNNAGITKDGLLIRMTEENFDKVINTNLRGAFTCMREAAKIMSKDRIGRIINLTSISGQRGNFGQSNYAAAKAGLMGMTKTAALELASRNITVNAVSPGFITTDMTDAVKEEVREKVLASIPLGRAGDAEEVADLVAFLASGKADYITGQEIAINGGTYL